MVSACSERERLNRINRLDYLVRRHKRNIRGEKEKLRAAKQEYYKELEKFGIRHITENNNNLNAEGNTHGGKSTGYSNEGREAKDQN